MRVFAPGTYKHTCSAWWSRDGLHRTAGDAVTRRRKSDGTTHELEEFRIDVKPWPTGVRETTRLCFCPNCRGLDAHQPHELAVDGHPLGGVYIADGEWIVRAGDPGYSDIVVDAASVAQAYT